MIARDAREQQRRSTAVARAHPGEPRNPRAPGEESPGGARVVYEIPWSMADDWPRLWSEYVTHLDAALAQQRRGDAVELFLRVAGTGDDEIASIKSSPYWAGMEGLAHTLAYEAACLGDGRPPATRLASISQPTLVATGRGHPPGSPAWVQALDGAADQIAASIPRAQRRRLEGQSHVVDPETFAPVLARFLGG